MASPSLTWTINPERGTIAFGRTIPFAGNTYDLTIAGGDAGESYTAFVMDETGLKCLAKSVTTGGSTSIAFNSVDVWNSFVREPHEIKTFHCIVRDGDKSVAEGDISVMWNPLWEDTQTGAVYTMRGPKGNTGNPGTNGAQGDPGKSAYEVALENGYIGSQSDWLQSLKGPPGSSTMAHCDEDDKWYEFTIGENEYGDKVLKVNQTGQEYDADTSSYVSRTQNQTILGTKTFTISPVIPTIESASDNSTKAASTGWVNAFCAVVKSAFTGSETHTWAATQTFNVIPVVKQDGIELDTIPATDNEKTINKVVDIDGSTIVEDTFKHSTSDGYHAFIGRIKRIISGVTKWCAIETSISSSGRRAISLTNADEVNVPTASSGDNSTKAASTAFVNSALAAFDAGSKFVKMQEFSGLTTSVATKTISGLTASQAYKVLLIWSSYAAAGRPTIDGTNQTSGIGLFCTTLDKTANSYGNVTFTIKVENVSYNTSVVAIVIKQ